MADLHRFYKHQPDTNIANPKLREEIRRIVGFWLEIGLSGFRVNAVPSLLETDGRTESMNVAPHNWLRDLRDFVGRRRWASASATSRSAWSGTS
jgi:glycosidase